MAIDVAADARMSPSGVLSAVTGPLDTGISDIQWPADIRLGGLLDSRLSFRKPLPVSLYKDQDVYVARCIEVDNFGYGSNSSEALDDLGKTLSEMYFFLSEAERSGALGESLATQYSVLCEYVVRRDVHTKVA